MTVNPADPETIPKFVDPLPIPPILKPVRKINGKPYYEVRMRQTQQQVHRDFPVTTLWGYNGMWPGPTIAARRNCPIKVHWINELPTTSLLTVDHSIFGAEALFSGNGTQNFRPDVRNVVHLHGINAPAEYDGTPDQWYTPGLTQIGPLFKTDVFEYPNRQPAAQLHYHDHAIGITRLNVYSGLQGFYFIRDAVEEKLPLPKIPYEIPILITDRQFNPDGSLFYPEHWEPQFLANTIAVNGKLWPYLDVEPRRYRFRILNGSNSRFYQLRLDPVLTFHVIGTDDGLMERPAAVEEFLLAPGERVDVIVDFTGQRGKTFTMTNSALAPFDVGLPPNPNTDGLIMQFRVNQPMSGKDHSRIPKRLAQLKRLNPNKVAKIRDVTLNDGTEREGEEERAIVLLGTRNLTGRTQPYLWGDSTTEKPVLGSTEIWRLINTSPGTHPIHLHLVRFLILDRQPYDVEHFEKTGELVFTGPRVPPATYERGYKDVVRANPGEVTRIIARFVDYAGLYVWHCHILEHEENEMMRRMEVVRPGCRTSEPAASRSWAAVPRRQNRHVNRRRGVHEIRSSIKRRCRRR
ncbi:multicopper oxidase family protein [Cohnella sp. AR92]|uniref:multicopper oxidase family protein n=1 Tax=Cohnella sp. AR92 TaxID=648716 RepID=UPI000F8EF855|nr:multicopper oxidase [Cohnella sp. AR92]RUS47047.1 multicopper oxidase family protein [Cohnella sp. AR92]